MTAYIKFDGEPIYGDQAIAAIAGPRGKSAAQQLYDAGLIPEPTTEAMNAYLGQIGAEAGQEAAEAVVGAVSDRVTDLEEIDAGDRLDALDPVISSQRASKFLMSPVTGGSVSRGAPPVYRHLQSRDLPKLTVGGRSRHIGTILDDMGRSIEWHRSKSRPFDGVDALEGALNFREGNGTGRRHVVISGYGWQVDAYPSPSRLSNAVIDCNGIAVGAPPTFVAADPSRPILYLSGVKNLRLRRAYHAAYRAVPASTNVRAVHIRDGASNIYIDELILENTTTALYLDNCSGVRIGRLVAPNASAAVVATATAHDVRIGEIISPGTVTVASGGDVKIGPVIDNPAGVYLAYGSAGYSSLSLVTRQELFEKVEALEADRLARDAINLTGNLPDNATLTRASTATYFNAAGVMVTAAIDVPRLSYRWNGTARVPAGLQIEPASTNLLSYSDDFTNAFWAKSGMTLTANSGPALDGGAGMALMTSTGTMVLREASTTTAVDGGAYVFSGFFKQGPTPTPWVMMTIGNATTPTSYVRMWFNPSTGQIGSVAAVGAGWSAIGTPEVEQLENGVYRVSFAAQIAGAAVCYRQDHVTANGIGGSSQPGIQLYVAKFQLEPQSKMTSYIPTTTAPSSRAADVAKLSWKTPRRNPIGPISVRYTFDDGTTQTRTGVALTNGISDIPTDLNRRKIKLALNLSLEG